MRFQAALLIGQLQQKAVAVAVCAVFVRVAQRVDDDAAAVLHGVHDVVGVSGNPVLKARYVNLVDEIGVERRVGIGRRDAGEVRRKMGEHDGARAVAELLNKAKLGVETGDVVFGFNVPFARRCACGDVEKIGDAVAGKGDVFAELFFGRAMLPEIAPQRAADKGVAAKLQTAVLSEQRCAVGNEFARQVVDVFAVKIVVAEHEYAELARALAGSLKGFGAAPPVAEVSGVDD